MPTTKHKRKLVKHAKNNHKVNSTDKPLSLTATHPSAIMALGVFFIVLGLYFLITGMQSNAEFGVSMLLLTIGVGIVINSNFFIIRKNKAQSKKHKER